MRALAAAALVAVVAADANGLVRDARLDRPLEELLAYPVGDHDDIDDAIHETLALCRARGITGVVRSNTEVIEPLSDDVTFCHRVRYVRHARERQRQRAVSSPLDLKAPHPIDKRSTDDVDFQTFFESFAERRMPLVLSSSPPLIENDAVLSSCFAPSTQFAPLQLDDDACIPWLEQLSVPLITASNFIPRTSVATAPALVPTLVSVTEAPVDITCLFGLHTVVVPVDGAVDVRLDDDASRPLREFTEVDVAPDASIDIDVAGRDRVEPHETLFVPGEKYVVRLDGTAHALRFCVVDASNFNFVTETLRVDALVDDVATRLFLSLQSPTFDTTMTRRPSPSDTRWNSYMTWPKETKLLKRRDMTAETLSRRERLKLWHDDKRWERHIASLTLPVPLPPVVMHATRTAVTLRWQDLYEHPKHDITEYGYELAWRLESPPMTEDEDTVTSGAVNVSHAALVRSAMPTTLFGDDFDGKDIEGVVRGLAADATYSFSVRIYVGDTLGVASERSRNVRTAPCSVPVRVPGVVAAVATPSPSCLDVRWLAPSDDGGRRITSFVFGVRYLDAPLAYLTPGDDRLERQSVVRVTISSGSWLSGSICDQLPGRVQLRVAAVNVIGVSAWSAVSAPMEIPKSDRLADRVPTIRGRGDPAFFSNSSSDHRHLRVLLSDVRQQLVVNDSRVVDVWTGHYSPKQFHVSSELVLADPLDASAPLRNAADVRDRVVVVTRGRVPFVFKVGHAQRAGALGVVIVAVDGRCSRGYDQRCVPGATQRNGEGFGASDRAAHWRDVRIPVVLAASPSLLEQEA